MYCPKCRYEYQSGVTECPDCNEVLVEELLCEDASEPECNGGAEFDPDEEIVKLCSAADDFEADIIISMLRAEGIYAAKHYRGTDGYSKIILGLTMLGIDILVGERSYERALEIIKS